MRIYIASDHGGFEAKEALLNALAGEYEFEDLGPAQVDPADDYPVYAEKLAKKVAADPGSMGILVCRSGEGMEIAANKIDGIRAALAWNEDVARETRRDNDSNVLSLPSDQISHEELIKVARAWLGTEFSNDPRHVRRIEEIKDIEEEIQ